MVQEIATVDRLQPVTAPHNDVTASTASLRVVTADVEQVMALVEDCEKWPLLSRR